MVQEQVRVASQNHKMGDSGIVGVPEIEGTKPCIYMTGEKFTDSPMCPGCYAAATGPQRRATSGGRASTPEKGLIRLGTNREILPEDYDAFVAGRGVRENGEAWVRPDFQTRNHFLITRGILDWAFYERIMPNPHLINVQVSVDILVTGDEIRQIPDDARLRQFLAHGKVMFRFKTLAAPAKEPGGDMFGENVRLFQELRDRLGIPKHRILETPLRLSMNRTYQTLTPLEAAGEDSREFTRCNSECGSCGSSKPGEAENRVMVCGATEKVLAMLARIGNTVPLRVEAKPRVKIPWTELTRRAWISLGGTASLQDIYAKVRELEPAAAHNLGLTTRVRGIVQSNGENISRGVWRYTGGAGKQVENSHQPAAQAPSNTGAGRGATPASTGNEVHGEMEV